MPVLQKSRRLKKELGLFRVYAIATGATVSSGFFLLPGLAAASAGPAVFLSYLLAAVPLIPAIVCLVELATAMPRAGGPYYFLDRTMGPLVGTIGGIGIWVAVVLKTAFALIGVGAYLALFVPNVPIVAVAAGMALFFGALNLFGAKASGTFQIVLVAGLIGVLAWFIGGGLFEVRMERFANLLGAGSESIFGTAGMVYLSYVGVTKVASISEEVKDPERNLPLAIFLAVATAIVIYGLGTFVMAGVIPPEVFHGDLTPAATAAQAIGGTWGVVIASLAAFIAFASVGNVGILTASRYPLAMSRDHLIPRALGRLSRQGIPRTGVLLTVFLILASLALFDPARLAKLASAFHLFMFALICLAVIIMRESQIDSYDPGYRSPFYPYLQIAGIIAPLWLLSHMGWLAFLLTMAVMTLSVAWYLRYARPRVARQGAIMHIFERLGRQRYGGLETELRSIIKEKGARTRDPYDEVLARADIIDVPDGVTFEEVTRLASEALAEYLPKTPEWIAGQFLDGTRIGATPVARGVAMPHFRDAALKRPRLVMVRSVFGIRVEPGDAAWGGHSPDQGIHALFYLVSPEADPGQHLRVLAQIANHVESDTFMSDWLAASADRVKEIMLREERFLTLQVRPDSAIASWIGRPVRDLGLPEGCLVALVRRQDGMLVPRGGTVLEADDWLTIIGEPKVIRRLYHGYIGSPNRDSGRIKRPAG